LVTEECYTQNEIAEAVGVPRDTLQVWKDRFVENSLKKFSTKQTFSEESCCVDKKQG